jgi:predicted AlkP superfamily pyrophosphatase or phosphodiesterase
MKIKNIVPVITMICTGLCNSVFAQKDTTVRVMEARSNSIVQQKKPYLILISGDGFRWDYAQKYHAENLLRLSKEGVAAESMLPSFPASTLPNHYTLMTGLYPSHSGIVGNTFYDANRKENLKVNDGSFFGEEPLWVTAEKAGMLTADFNWPNMRPAIKNTFATYSFTRTSGKRPADTEAIDLVKNWLSLPEDKRPHFIALHLGETDHAGHQHGPESKEVEEAVKLIDGAVGEIEAIAKKTGLAVNFVFVSDHGMTPIDPTPLNTPASIDKQKFVCIVQGNYVAIHAKDQADILPLYEKLKAEQAAGFDVVLKKDLPKYLHFGPADDKYNRIGDIMLMAHHPKVFAARAPKGAHGFSPYEQKDVHASFYAWGPAFKQNLTVKAFGNIEVYSMMAKILGIQPLPNDGKGTLAKQVLK